MLAVEPEPMLPVMLTLIVIQVNAYNVVIVLLLLIMPIPIPIEEELLNPDQLGPLIPLMKLLAIVKLLDAACAYCNSTTSIATGVSG